MSDEREHCPRCNSPDFVPYKFDDGDMGHILKRHYPNARKCVDCGVSFYNYELQTAPRVVFSSLNKAKDST